MKAIRQIGSLAFVLGLFVSIFLNLSLLLLLKCNKDLYLRLQLPGRDAFSHGQAGVLVLCFFSLPLFLLSERANISNL